MIGFVIPCNYINRFNLIKLINTFDNKNFLRVVLIIDNRSYNFIKKNFKLYKKNFEIIINDTKNVSLKRNLGINYFFGQKEISWISFLDCDCFINNKNINLLKNLIKKYSNLDILLINLKSLNGIQVGNKLKNRYFFNFLNIYRAGTPSIVIKKTQIRFLFDIYYGIGSVNYSAEDTKFLIDNYSKKIHVANEININHPLESPNYDKIKNYTIGQKNLIKRVKYPHSLLFFLVIIHRPIIGLFINTIFFNKSKIRIYLMRLKILIYG